MASSTIFLHGGEWQLSSLILMESEWPPTFFLLEGERSLLSLTLMDSEWPSPPLFPNGKGVATYQPTLRERE